MKWDFTPEDILNDKAHYSITQFKQDLFIEVQGGIEKSIRKLDFDKILFAITVMICLSTATGKSLDSFFNAIRDYLPNSKLQKMLTDKKLLTKIRQNNRENIEMLKAVISKRIRDDLAIGIEPDCITQTMTDELLKL
jgi:hypothetical protein